MPTKSEKTRHKILISAGTLFYEKGLLCTSQQDIANLANVNRGLIHHYFGSKEAIAATIIEQFVDDFYSTLNALYFKDEPDVTFVSIVQGRIIFNFLLTNAHFKRFFMELILQNVINGFIERSVLRDFRKECAYLNLNYSAEQMQVYSMVLASVECKLMSSKMSESHTLPIEEVISIYNRIHLGILGLREEETERIIQRAIETSRSIRFECNCGFKVLPECFIKNA